MRIRSFDFDFARFLVFAVAAIALVLGLTTAPSARADDRLQFTGTTLGGSPFNGASLMGKPAVLWFWASYCPFCNAEAPGVSDVAATNPNVTFVGIVGRSSIQEAEGFVSKYGLNFTNVMDADGSIWRQFGVGWQPAYVFLRADGSSTFVNNPLGAMPEDELSDHVHALTA